MRAADPPFDAIIVDAQMPDCDGPETIARVRVVAPDLPAILTSGCSPDEEPASPFAFLQKPFTAADLVAVLGRAVATRS